MVSAKRTSARSRPEVCPPEIDIPPCALRHEGTSISGAIRLAEAPLGRVGAQRFIVARSQVFQSGEPSMRIGPV